MSDGVRWSDGHPVAGSNGLDVSFSITGCALVVALRGDADLAGVGCLPALVAAAVGAGDDFVVLDLAGVRFADGSLVQAVLGCRAVLGSSGPRVAVRSPSASVRRLFELSGVRDLLETTVAGELGERDVIERPVRG